MLVQLQESGLVLSVFSQDSAEHPRGIERLIDDTDLKYSYFHTIETVPTVIKVEDGKELDRMAGWHRSDWESFTGVEKLGTGLPDYRPGCGALNVAPGMMEKLAARFETDQISARKVELASMEDEIEACFDRGWSDGLPVVPPTAERVIRMLRGTSRSPQEIVGIVPPDNVECSVEKVAINSVLAGCKPEYLPVVLAAVEAACMDAFCMHGLLATTWFSGPVVIVNGPIAGKIGMNSGINALGQGNRANATIGRALQLVIRNVGGGRPGGVDRSTFGNPGKFTFCFAENEADSPWNSLSAERGFSADSSTVSLFAGDGVQGIIDQRSREPESLVRTYAACLQTVAHPKLAVAPCAMLLISPEHARVFKNANWSKDRLKKELHELLLLEGKELVEGANGIAEGLPIDFKNTSLPKFTPDNLHILHVGGKAGMFSAIIGGWIASGQMGSQSVTREIRA